MFRKKSLKIYGFLGIGLFLFLGSCQKNDICTEGKPSTPRLIIQFMDEENPEEVKAVESFNAKEIGSDAHYFSENIDDTLVKIPLKTAENETKYEFYTHMDDSLSTQTNQLKFSYHTADVFINSACGFRNTFEDFEADLLSENSTDGWINYIETPDTINQIDDEQDTHLYIYH